MYYNGVYHLFYQYNPKGAVWGNIVWAHSVSTDLINWLALEPAIHPTEPFDINGCWSGSATILPGNRPVILYTASTPSAVSQLAALMLAHFVTLQQHGTVGTGVGGW
uniref:Glycosyl hydrolase family 32 N-terminal domain-containing protein n=1 Tax=Ananas comosus var. bracteatus TaxID=296719 RepID=A0A6V7P296_ANACO|nr:unnamed protein product [Ananas comosus var. bracteatus]